ncbi:solute carrier family 10 (sodium/bile acid cotransporter), member 7 [Modicisalibacter muralis]|uniref:Solute carrier family 10 (Sodium/bile acid cotransporter), member 7 n=1 Tax=Modicisalibacter muralis TaxID=119000 RepID=A0A1G9IDT4_9GAMM|nr:bile acid:sodium symporter family protein [Halomonas muralis]SDL23391.1 solute carrier family 10 (sodium/bile acid cotransporter), member 7 [Halomonas muralis]
MRFRLDPFTLLLLGTIGLATVLPARGDVAEWLGHLSVAAIALLFFLHGAALSREEVLAGATHWRLHLLIVSLTFVVFPLIVLPISTLAPRWIPEDLALGFLYLGVLPSAVSSSIAFTAMARGNVPAAVCSAAASNVFGMMLTPFLLILLVSTAGGGFAVGDALRDIFLQLLLPFAAGQAIRPWVAGLMQRHKSLTGRYDQGVILLIVYSAFSQSVASGLWQKLPLTAIGIAIALCVFLLGLAILLARFLAARLGLRLADEAAAVFCGSKKSLASGLPMAKVLFAGHPGFGMIVLPIMCYNQIQIIVGAVLARRYERCITARAEEGPRVTTSST